MLHQEIEPPECLRDTIQCFWYTRLDFRDLPSTFVVQPDGYAEIIFHFGSGCRISYDGDSQQMQSPFIIGLLNQPFILHAKNNLEIIGIRCFPWTVFDLLGLQPGEGGVRILEHPIGRLQSALNNCIQSGSINEALTLVKQYFFDSGLPVAANHNILFKAGVAMREANGTMPVSDVAAAAHTTVRTLERRFKLTAGHTVKDVSALMRFEQVRNRLWLNPYCHIAALAHELGYADQSHLSRDFKRYSGVTPAAFARKAKKGNCPE